MAKGLKAVKALPVTNKTAMSQRRALVKPILLAV